MALPFVEETAPVRQALLGIYVTMSCKLWKTILGILDMSGPGEAQNKFRFRRLARLARADED